MDDMKQVYKDLIVEMVVDFSSIFAGLLILQKIGFLMFEGGWGSLWRLFLCHSTDDPQRSESSDHDGSSDQNRQRIKSCGGDECSIRHSQR